MRPTTGDAMTVAEKVQAEKELHVKLLNYAGRWVAVLDYEVTHDAATWSELLEQLDEGERERAELFHVSEHPDALHLY
jgi:hypothetical protein